MESILLSAQDAVSQGVLWGVMALGVYITFRILNFADMTVDGSFAAGGCVCATLIVLGVNPWLSLIIATVMGMCTGLVTGILHTTLKIPSILAGILTQLGLYSINLRIMGRANTPMLKSITIIKQIEGLFNISSGKAVLGIGIIFIICIISLLYLFFGTEIGASIRATGNNEDMIRALGVNTNATKVIALVLANALVALSGALISQSQGFGDIGMGLGTIVIGLASIVIGEVFTPKGASFAVRLLWVVIGSIIYRLIIAIVLYLGMNANDLRLITAIIVAAALAFPSMISKMKTEMNRYIR
jgi:ABC-type uncharacterized transport system, permease component